MTDHMKLINELVDNGSSIENAILFAAARILGNELHDQGINMNDENDIRDTLIESGTLDHIVEMIQINEGVI